MSLITAPEVVRFSPVNRDYPKNDLCGIIRQVEESFFYDCLGEDFKDYLEFINKAVYKPKNPKLRLLKNKVRNVTLNDRYVLIERICNASAFNSMHENYVRPKIPYWLLAFNLKLWLPFFKYNKNLKQINIDAKKNRSNKKKKAYLTMLISKFIKEALNISENAARGIFPLTTSSKNFLKFDFDALSKILDQREIISFDRTFSSSYESMPHYIKKYNLNSFYHRYEKYKENEFNRKYSALTKKYGYLSFKNGKLDKRELNKRIKESREIESYEPDPPDSFFDDFN